MTITYDHIRATVPDIQGEARTTPVRMSLLPQAVMSLDGRHTEFILYCHGGRLWLTQQGDPTDHILSAGDSFVARGTGRLVLQSLEETVVSVAPLH